jgi:hypothetical protein
MKIDPKLITAISGNYTTAFEVHELLRKLRAEYDATKLEVTALQATRLQLIVLVAILIFLFGGIFTAGSKMVFDWITTGRAVVEPRPVAPRASASPQAPPSSPLLYQPPPRGRTAHPRSEELCDRIRIADAGDDRLGLRQDNEN